MNVLKGWRVLIINGATLVVMLGAAFTGTVDDPATLKWITIGVAAANVLMRWATTTAVGKAN